MSAKLTPLLHSLRKQQTIIDAPHAIDCLNLVVVAQKGFLPQFSHFLLPLVRRQHPERVKILHVFPVPAADPMRAQTSEIIHVDNAGGMEQRLCHIAQEDPLYRDAQIFTPIDQINVGKWHVSEISRS